MALTPGLMLSDRYRLTRRIAVGGMGEVWAADDTRLARTVAVKILKSELSGDPEFLDRFRSEARITASLNHPGIAAVYDYGEVAIVPGGRADTAFLVMELVVGEPLSAVLARTGRLTVARTLDVAAQSGRALQAAHVMGLVHRDIKPGNIMITPTGQVKLTDFGIAKVTDSAPVTRTGMVMGTAQYLSPEQAAGREAVPASDTYALGVVTYECLAGRRPFEADSPVAVAMAHLRDMPPPLPGDVPPPVAALVLRMLVKDPAQRLADGAAVASAVTAVRSGGSLPPPPVDAPATRMMPPVSVPPAPAAVVPPVTRPPVMAQPVRPVPVARRPAARRTALSVLLTILVLLLAGAAGVLIDRQAAPVPADPVRTLSSTGSGPGAVSAGEVRAVEATEPGSAASWSADPAVRTVSVSVPTAPAAAGSDGAPGVPPSVRVVARSPRTGGATGPDSER
ncbi:serine/threonine-protein kinase [Nakamurella flavida]|uniref:serine/threonine-protein kinase n=1 Tax=Nakamurella flavida TaxID=363630 RepID=UPI002789A8CA|nr:serine/threonine-protein kinase [Nakamurella flavida]MDP9778540.1 serine/threonine-protein kinase [Nakamurella flavida]